MKRARLQKAAVVAILVVTALLFIRFFQTHPQYVTELKKTSPWVVSQLLAVNLLLLGIITLLNQVLVRMSGKPMAAKENFLLSIYSTLANFFGPLQSGPGVRAAYLKAKHGVSLRTYTLATLLYYACFAIGAAFFLLVGTRPWWQTLFAVLLCASLSYGIIRWSVQRKQNSNGTGLVLSTRLLAGLALLTILQLLILALRYYIELKSVGAEVSLGQALSYAGSASLALFVSITPDGIGIREAFIMAAQQIHGVATPDIVSANLIDRAFYLVYLGLVFLVALATHAKDHFKPK